MKLLNVGCGGQRPQEEMWTNLDNLRTQLKEGTPERANLDREPRYVECDLLTQSIPFPADHFDGILLQHVLEHFTCHDAVDVLMRCRAVLKTGGLLCASVPDSDYFMKVHHSDTRENAVELFGEPISEPEHATFFSYALWHREHKVLFTDASLRCTLLRAGFGNRIFKMEAAQPSPVLSEIGAILNRRMFSLILCAYK